MKKLYIIIITFICVWLFNLSTCYADNEDAIFNYPKLRLGAGVGAGVLIAGNKCVVGVASKCITGGLSLTPSVLVGMKFNDMWGVSYQNLPNINSFKTINNIGILDENSLMLSFAPSSNMVFDLGPSLDITSLVLCDDYRFCDRQSGVVGGGHLRGALLGRFMSVGCGAVFNIHLSWIPSPYYTGFIFTSNMGPVCEW